LMKCSNVYIGRVADDSCNSWRNWRISRWRRYDLQLDALNVHELTSNLGGGAGGSTGGGAVGGKSGFVFPCGSIAANSDIQELVVEPLLVE
jgi:hypothetical protein